MIKLMHVNDYIIDTSQFRPLLNDGIIEEFENKISNYVGAEYACSIHSATMGIFMCLMEEDKQTITVPSIITPVVPNAVLNSGHEIAYRDDVEWVGHSYTLHEFENYKIIDSAQQLDKNQFTEQANDNDIMIFSFYPTKPLGSIDGGLVVSNDKTKIDRLKLLSRHGSYSTGKNSWERNYVLPGWKMYMNSVQACTALQNFERLEEKMQRFDEVREIYNDAFGLDNTSRHLYRIRVENRDNFISKMKEDGIQCGIHYQAVHKIDCYKSDIDTDLPQSEIETNTTVSLPFHEMLTEEEILKVIKGVKSAELLR